MLAPSCHGNTGGGSFYSSRPLLPPGLSLMHRPISVSQQGTTGLSLPNNPQPLSLQHVGKSMLPFPLQQSPTQSSSLPPPLPLQQTGGKSLKG